MRKLNFFFKDFFGIELDMELFDNRIRLQKLIYILNHYGIRLGYHFTWWKYGPYSPKLTEDGYAQLEIEPKKLTNHDLSIIEKIKKGKMFLQDSGKAELIASYLYLEKHLTNREQNEIIEELLTRKPYLTSAQIQRTMSEWNKAVCD
jgi:uncharacterized protein YwgA